MSRITNISEVARKVSQELSSDGWQEVRIKTLVHQVGEMFIDTLYTFELEGINEYGLPVSVRTAPYIDIFKLQSETLAIFENKEEVE